MRFLKKGTVYIMNNLAEKMIGERETGYCYVVILWQFFCFIAIIVLISFTFYTVHDEPP